MGLVIAVDCGFDWTVQALIIINNKSWFHKSHAFLFAYNKILNKIPYTPLVPGNALGIQGQGPVRALKR